MIRAFIRLGFPLLLAAPALASAARHSYALGSFDRVRVEGPFVVNVMPGSPSAVAEGDPRALDRVDVSVQGTTLVVRAGSQGWGETPVGRAVAPAIVTLHTPMLRGVSLNGGARVTATGLRAQRVDLAVNGAGTLSASGVDADELNLVMIGNGSATIAGKALRARYATNGAATLDAAALQVNDLTVLQDGSGETRAAARYTAQIGSRGLGRIVILGKPKCTVQRGAVGPVECGSGLDE